MPRELFTPSVLIVDDHASLRRGLRALLQLHERWEVCGEAVSGESAIEMVAALKPDTVLMDVSMPGIGGLEATKIVHQRWPDVKLVLVTFHKSVELVRAALLSGASGYILKSDPESAIIDALEAAIRDRIFITPELSPAAVLQVLNELKMSPSSAGANGDKRAPAKTQLTRPG